MDQVDVIMIKIKSIFKELGFKEFYVKRPWTVEPELNFVFGELYCRPDYDTDLGLGFLIEYAHDPLEAKNNLYGDGDSFPLELGQESILEGIRNELQEAISEINVTAQLPVVMQVAV